MACGLSPIAYCLSPVGPVLATAFAYLPSFTEDPTNTSRNVTFRFADSNLSFNSAVAVGDSKALGQGGAFTLNSPASAFRDPHDPTYNLYNHQFLFYVYHVVLEILDSVFEGNRNFIGGAFGLEGGDKCPRRDQ